MTIDEIKSLSVGELVMTPYHPRGVCRFVAYVPSTWSVHLECVHGRGIWRKGMAMLFYVAEIETVAEASEVCRGDHESGDDGACVRCGFSREAIAWIRENVR